MSLAKEFRQRREGKSGYIESGRYRDRVVVKNGEVIYYLHDNPIAKLTKGNDLLLDDTGWQSKTTRRRMNEILDELRLNTELRVYKRKWYICKLNPKPEYKNVPEYCVDWEGFLKLSL